MSPHDRTSPLQQGLVRTAASPPSAGSGLRVIPVRAAEQHVLIVVGEVDVANADQLRGHLTDALAGRPPELRIDLRGLDFCDLSGLDALHDAARTAANEGVYLTFSGVSALLAWMHHAFPTVDEPPTTPGTTVTAPVRWAGDSSSTTTSTLTTPARTADTAASVREPLASPRQPAAPRNDARGISTAFKGLRTARQKRQVAGANGLQADRDQLLHAVPTEDATRSAVCGARVHGPHALWDPWDPRDRCPDCMRLVTERRASRVASPA